MLSHADNELLTKVGPGTPMGALFRRFWAPIALASEVGGPDAPPVRVTALGEKLVLFRDTAGVLGLLAAYCPHRRANLFWGRNEEHGLRCVYHGWKFDATGQCVDMPNCPEGATLKDRVRTQAYPAIERGGLIWAYLGPPEHQPEFPANELFESTPERRHLTKIAARGNWLQFQEGDIDSSHVSFLHSSLGNKPLAGVPVNPNTYLDTQPRWFVSETAYGMQLAAQRDAGPDQYQWRVNQYLMPYATMIATIPGRPILAQVRLPVDDENAVLFRYIAHPERALTEAELSLFNGGVTVPAMIPGTFTTVENVDNDYLIDRERQRTESFTGITSIVAQDLAVVQDQGGGTTMDRSLEYLTSGDRAIIALRKRLLSAIKALQNGVEPPEARNPQAYRVRPGDFMLPRDVDLERGGKDILRPSPLVAS
jgi:phenylpropionate dioxygenase-like ring-hydroxylating dioxygenase large terminal subunit